MSESAGRIRETIGRIEAKLDSVGERMAEMKETNRDAQRQSERDREAIWAEIRNVKHENRNELQTLTSRLDLQDNAIKGIANSIDAQKATIAKVETVIDGPLAYAINFQRRLTAIGLLVISIAALAWNMRDFFWQFLQFIFHLGQGAK